ncbi:bifunctional 3-(3-hydroxy-phenyl)propionate/3-hydroxycinnamic acid hydroxylase [Microbacterium insulae]|uniref:Bifunctional 3-(3-hydroxy-phenyl)propionate/3-hydroxycinnamic acid hydroxylase n=1 Tax=Microbacterium insulae TaxID=483014 RepID=A0ABW3AHL9_9MICO
MAQETLTPEDSDLDVIIVGMGPVGKMAALLLGRAGHSVLVVERKTSTYPLPRAVAHDAEIARLLQAAGMPVDSVPDAVEPYDDMYVWVNAQRETLHQVDWTGIDPSGWNNTYFYNQPALESHLEERMRSQASVSVLRGVVAEVQGQDDAGADVRLIPVDGSPATVVRGRYVLGADGANSATRQAMGIEWNDLGYFFDWLVVDVVPQPEVEVTHLALQICDPVRPTTVVPGGPGRRRWEFMRLEGESVESLTQPARIWEMLAPFGVTAENSELERGVVYTFNSGWASHWRSGRTFLLGDAAHLMPPFAGQGLAAGFRDCLNLTWKLDLVLRGFADDELLDSYASERMTHVSDFIAFSMELGKIICIVDPEQARRRDEAMIADLASGRTPEPPPAPRLGGDNDEGVHTGRHGGVLSRQGYVRTRTNPEPTRFDDVFGAGALILRDASVAARLDAAARDGLQERGIAVVALGGSEEDGAFIDVNGTYGSWFDEWDVDAVLVRPDFYVYGTVSREIDSAADGVRDLVRSFLARTGTASSEPRLDAPAREPGDPVHV